MQTFGVPRPLRIQYPGAQYHVMSRGDRREAIFLTTVIAPIFCALWDRPAKRQADRQRQEVRSAPPLPFQSDSAIRGSALDVRRSLFALPFSAFSVPPSVL